MCVGIIWNNSLINGRARAESNPGSWARHALLHMAPDSFDHWATVHEQVFIVINLHSPISGIKQKEKRNNSQKNKCMHNYKQRSKQRLVSYTGQYREQ